MRSYLRKVLEESVEGVIAFNKRLRDHTTFKIGGVSSVWFEPVSLEDLKRALIIFSKKNLKPFLIGKGSNILVYDGRINRAVIKLSAPYFKRIEFGDRYVICGSGHSLSGLIKKCIEKGLAGLEEFAGIPGTVGGAIASNAGTRVNNITDLIEWVRIMDYRGRKASLLKKNRIKFKYRDSNLSRYIILEAKFGLKSGSPRIARKVFDKNLEKKRRAQEYSLPNAGCVFKNPLNSRLTSGQIIEQCGLKGLRIGDAEVSSKHANFIINRGRARFRDIISLIKLEQDIVKKNCGVWLEPEIKIVR